MGGKSAQAVGPPAVMGGNSAQAVGRGETMLSGLPGQGVEGNGR